MPSSTIATSVGLTTGVLGVSIAVYLQLICSNRVSPKYVLTYLGLGTLLITINIEPLIAYTAGQLTILAYIITCVAQLYTAKHVIQNSELIPTDLEMIHDA